MEGVFCLLLVVAINRNVGYLPSCICKSFDSIVSNLTKWRVLSYLEQGSTKVFSEHAKASEDGGLPPTMQLLANALLHVEDSARMRRSGEFGPTVQTLPLAHG